MYHFFFCLNMFLLFNKTINYSTIIAKSRFFGKKIDMSRTIIQNYSNKHKQLPLPQSSKLICISPGGFKGFYLSGIIAYIKENYNTSNCIFSGASAGAWNSLLFSYKGNLTELIYNVIGERQIIRKNESINEFEYYLKNQIISNYNTSDFELNRVYIGVTTVETYLKKPNIVGHLEYIHDPSVFFKTSIYYDFTTLEDALDCCIASSHIPFFMGKILHNYNRKIVFDGGFSHYPYYPLLQPILNITPNMWNPNILNRRKFLTFEDYTTLLSKEKYNFIDLFWKGYNDTLKNHDILDKILPKKTK